MTRDDFLPLYIISGKIPIPSIKNFRDISNNLSKKSKSREFRKNTGFRGFVTKLSYPENLTLLSKKKTESR